MDDDSHSPDGRTVTGYLHQLRSGSPTPGGGSAAAYAGAMGAALLAMVCRLTLKSGPNSELDSAASELDELVDKLSAVARQDEECYGRYRAATALPKGTEQEKSDRRLAMQSALVAAGRSPLASARMALDCLKIATPVAKLGTRHALSDVETALVLLIASIDGSVTNINVNIGMISDPDIVTELSESVAGVTTRSAHLEMLTRAELVDRSQS